MLVAFLVDDVFVGVAIFFRIIDDLVDVIVMRSAVVQVVVVFGGWVVDWGFWTASKASARVSSPMHLVARSFG